MPTKAPTHRPMGPKPIEVRESSSVRGYDHAWRKVRAQFLAAHPLCCMCAESGRTTQANVVDHIQTIASAPHLRLSWSNLRPMCESHHNAHTARTQGFGKTKGVTSSNVVERR